MAGYDFIDTNCPGCGARLKLPAEQAGKHGRCPKCQQIFPIPSGSTSSPPSGFDSMLNDLQPASGAGNAGPYVGSPQSSPSPFTSGGNPYASTPDGFGPVTGGNNPYQTNPYGQGNFNPPPSPQSVLPKVSLVAGIITWFGCCCSVISIPASLTAIITGHMALYQATTNRASAFVGMILGYLYIFVAVSIFVIAMLAPNPPPKPAQVPLPQSYEALEQAEEFLDLSDEVDHFDGNSQESLPLAEEFSATLAKAQSQIFNEEELQKFDLDVQPPAVWCELSARKTIFIVSVPAYEQFSQDQQRQVTEVAWKIAHDLAHRELQPGDEVGLAFRDANGDYTVVRIGRLGINAQDIGRIEYDGTSRDRLPTMFESPPLRFQPAEPLPGNPEDVVPPEMDAIEPPATVESTLPAEPPAEGAEPGEVTEPGEANDTGAEPGEVTDESK